MIYRIYLYLLIVMTIIPLTAFPDASLLHNAGKVQMLISDWGAFTKVEDGKVYPNFIYSGKAYLDPFSDIWVGDSKGNVASAYEGTNEGISIGEWIATNASGTVSYISDSPNSSQTIHAKYTPVRYNNFPYKISIEQYSYAWDSANYPADDDYIIIKLILTNNGNADLSDIYIAVQSNWDVNYEEWDDDLVDWDTQRLASISYDSNGTDKTYLALALLYGNFSSHNIVDANKFLFTDFERSYFMSNSEIDNINVTGKKPGNYLGVISTGPYAIPAGGSVTVIYSFVAGQGIDELRSNIDSAYDRIITPEKLTAEQDENSVKLKWSKCIRPDIKSYKIYRSKTSESGFREIAQVSSEENFYIDMEADKASLSYYVVSSISSDGKESKYSNEVSSVPGTAPSPPKNLTIKSDNRGKPLLIWDDSQDLNIKGYKIFRNSTGTDSWTPIATVDKNNTSFIDANTFAGNTYYYTIATINMYNWVSEYSNVVSITLESDNISKPSQNLREVKVLPQPCKSSAKFINLTAMTNISIYTIDGRLVKKIYHVNRTGEEEWDLNNDAGIPLANGVYVYYIEAYKPDETDKYIFSGKLTILR